MVAKIALKAATYAIDKPYDYAVPAALASVLRPGMRVIIPFGAGNRRTEGIVLALEDRDGDSLKPVLTVLDDSPVLDGEAIKLALWMRERWFCTVYDAARAMLPAGLYYALQDQWKVAEGVDREAAFEAAGKSDHARQVVELLFANGGSADVTAIREAFGTKDPNPALKLLRDKGIITLETSAQRGVGDKTEQVASLAIPAQEALDQAAARRRTAPMQYAVVELLCAIGEASTKELCYFTGASPATLRALVKSGVITLEKREVYRRVQMEEVERLAEPVLNHEQQAAFDGLNALAAQNKPAAALLGSITAQIGYGTPSIGGKDSMSGSFNALDVPPTLVSFAVGMSEASKTVSARFKRANSKVYMIEIPVCEETGLPDYEKAMKVMKAVYNAVRNGSVLAAGVVKEGGAAACVCKMAFGDKLGFTFEQELDMRTLFAAAQGNFVVEAADELPEEFENAVLLGATNDNGVFIIDGEVLTVDELIDAWCSKLEKVFPQNSGVSADMPQEVELYKERSIFICKNKVAKPRVFIPAFPGTNCEVDTARAFEKAGAETEILVVNNLSPAAINETIEKMVKAISNAQIVMLPGGFSGGDEPEGSGKFIATTFRNPKVEEAVMKLLNCRDGLMLGICNGFQALIKLGLVPYGEIREIKPSDPTLTFNTIGRHISQMAYTRVTSVKSPWLAGVNAGDVFAVPISHGEGRFTADAETIKRLAENGQIATQYVDLNGEPVSDMPFNPNGSVCAIEGITSPDGRVLGKMGHCERKGENLYANVPFEKDMKIFESGVNYFK